MSDLERQQYYDVLFYIGTRTKIQGSTYLNAGRKITNRTDKHDCINDIYHILFMYFPTKGKKILLISLRKHITS